MGLLSVAFHPDYATNGKFYVYYTTGNRYSRISEFQVSSDPNVADQTSERILLEVEQPATNHNGGLLQFGPDGYLYVGFGDGGGGGDTYHNGQNCSTLLGTISRIDVNSTTDSTEYGIPPDIRKEIWTWGMRNPSLTAPVTVFLCRQIPPTSLHCQLGIPRHPAWLSVVHSMGHKFSERETSISYNGRPLMDFVSILQKFCFRRIMVTPTKPLLCWEIQGSTTGQSQMKC